MTEDKNSHYSSYREMVLEHLFVSELMRILWLQDVTDFEMLMSKVDNSGYDIVLEANSVVRHIQLKSSSINSKTGEVKVNDRLAQKPSGCIIWMYFDPNDLSLGPFLWYGGSPGEKLPDLTHFKSARHTKANSEGMKSIRPHMKVVPKSKFKKVHNILALIAYLFGPINNQSDEMHAIQDYEAEILSACALRFDGYKYAQYNNKDLEYYYTTVGNFEDQPDFDLPVDVLQCILFFMQRRYLKERWLEWDSTQAKAIRMLFLKLCEKDIPVEFRLDDCYFDWMNLYIKDLKQHIEFVEMRHAHTQYSDSNEHSRDFP